MTAPNHLQVDIGQLRAHAGTVGDLAGQLSSVGGGLNGGLTDAALGTFVQFLTAGLGDAMTKTTEAVSHASSAVDDVSTGLTRAADSYQHTDEDGVAHLRRAAQRRPEEA